MSAASGRPALTPAREVPLAGPRRPQALPLSEAHPVLDEIPPALDARPRLVALSRIGA